MICAVTHSTSVAWWEDDKQALKEIGSEAYNLLIHPGNKCSLGAGTNLFKYKSISQNSALVGGG